METITVENTAKFLRSRQDSRTVPKIVLSARLYWFVPCHMSSYFCVWVLNHGENLLVYIEGLHAQRLLSGVRYSPLPVLAPTAGDPPTGRRFLRHRRASSIPWSA